MQPMQRWLPGYDAAETTHNESMHQMDAAARRPQAMLSVRRAQKILGGSTGQMPSRSEMCSIHLPQLRWLHSAACRLCASGWISEAGDERSAPRGLCQVGRCLHSLLVVPSPCRIGAPRLRDLITVAEAVNPPGTGQPMMPRIDNLGRVLARWHLIGLRRYLPDDVLETRSEIVEEERAA
jgi:hypothetical protein